MVHSAEKWLTVPIKLVTGDSKTGRGLAVGATVVSAILKFRIVFSAGGSLKQKKLSVERRTENGERGMWAVGCGL